MKKELVLTLLPCVCAVSLHAARPFPVPEGCLVSFDSPNGAPTMKEFTTGRPERVMPFGAGNLSAMVSFGTDDLHLHLSRTDYLARPLKDGKPWNKGRSLLSPGHVTVKFPGIEINSFTQTLDVARGEIRIRITTPSGPVAVTLAGDRATGALVGLVDDARSGRAAATVGFSNWRVGGAGLDGKIARSPGRSVFTESDPVSKRRYETVVLNGDTRRANWRFVVAMSPASAEKAMKTDVGDLVDSRIAWWRGYWEKGWVIIEGDADAELLTRLWFVNLYTWGSVGYGELPPKFNGGPGLIVEDRRDWGAGFWWQNTRELIWPMCAAGHADFAKKSIDFYDRCLAKLRSRRHLLRDIQPEGAFMPETLDLSAHPLWDGVELPRGKRAAKPYVPPTKEAVAAARAAREKLPGTWTSHIYTGSAEYIHQLIEYVRYTGDRSYLDVIAEWMRDWVELYLGILEKGSDGKWHVRCTNVNESWWKVDDSIVDLASVRFVFTQAAKHGAAFGYPGNLLEAVRERLRNLAPLPTCNELTITPWAETKRMDVMSYVPGTRQWAPRTGLKVGDPKGAYAPNEAYVIFPFGMSSANEADRARGLATCAALEKESDAIGGDNGPLGYWGWDHLPVCLMCLRATNAVEKLMKFVSRTHRWPYGGAKSPASLLYDGAPVEGTPYFDGAGVMQQAVQMMLLDDAPYEPSTDWFNGGELRLLPSVRRNWSGSFKLRARGNRTVLCKFKNGKATDVNVYSENRPARVEWDFPRTASCHEGLAFSDGRTGVLVWGGGDEIRLTVGRGDLWDHRGGYGWTEEQSYSNIVSAVRKGDSKRLLSLFKKTTPKGQPRNPYMLPLGRVVIKVPGRTLSRGTLDTSTGLGVLEFTDGTRAEIAMAKTLGGVFAMKFPRDVSFNAKSVPATDFDVYEKRLEPIGFEKAKTYDRGDIGGFTWNLPADRPVWLSWQKTGGVFVLRTGRDAPAVAARDVDFDIVESDSRVRWEKFWREGARVKVPDPVIQRVFDYGMYRFGAMTDPDGIPAGLQGQWLEDHRLVPWNGDYHFNINVQECYSPAFRGGHFAHLMPLFKMVLSWRPILRDNAKKFAGVEDGYVLPHSVDDRGVCIGGFWTGTIDHASTAWVAAMMMKYVRYSRDTEFLKSEAYDFMKGAMRVYRAMMEEYKGRLSIPVGPSPEWAGASVKGAVGRDSSFQLAAAHRLARDLVDAAEMLGEKPDPVWLDVIARLPVFTAGPGEIELFEGQTLTESHRHHSHMAGFYPFDVIDIDDPAVRKIAARTYATWVDKGTGKWTGWCVPWAAILNVHVGNAAAAASLLRDWEAYFCNPGHGSLHNAYEPGFTRWTICGSFAGSGGGQIMQMDGQCAAATAVMEMMVHETNGKASFFKGCPESWKDVSFENIRLSDGTKASGRRLDGKISVWRYPSGAEYRPCAR